MAERIKAAGGQIKMSAKVWSPESCSSSRNDSNTTLLLLLHPVHSCSTFVHFTYLVSTSSKKQNTLTSSSLASIDVGNDTNVTNSIKWDAACVGHTDVYFYTTYYSRNRNFYKTVSYNIFTWSARGKLKNSHLLSGCLKSYLKC